MNQWTVLCIPAALLLWPMKYWVLKDCPTIIEKNPYTVLSQFVSSWVIVRYDGIILRLASAWAKIGSTEHRAARSSGVGIILDQTSGPSRTWALAIATWQLLWAVTNPVQLSPLSNPSWDGALVSPSLQENEQTVNGGNQSALMTRWGIPRDSDRFRTDPESGNKLRETSKYASHLALDLRWRGQD